jgi:hypothetical protein
MSNQPKPYPEGQPEAVDRIPLGRDSRHAEGMLRHTDEGRERATPAEARLPAGERAPQPMPPLAPTSGVGGRVARRLLMRTRAAWSVCGRRCAPEGSSTRQYGFPFRRTPRWERQQAGGTPPRARSSSESRGGGRTPDGSVSRGALTHFDQAQASGRRVVPRREIERGRSHAGGLWNSASWGSTSRRPKVRRSNP